MRKPEPAEWVIIVLSVVVAALAVLLMVVRARARAVVIPEPEVKYIALNEDPIRRAAPRMPIELEMPILTVDYMWTSPIGERISPVFGAGGEMNEHGGIDIGAPWRARTRPAAPGVVLEHWPPPDGYYKGHPTFGGYIVIGHFNGLVTKYGHLAETFVHQGDIVDTDTVIGRVGSTGLSTGPHLHFAVEYNGAVLNPLIWLENPGS